MVYSFIMLTFIKRQIKYTIMKLILGNITFSNFSEEELKKFTTNTKNKAIVHEVYGVIDCGQAVGEDPKKLAYSIGEDLCNPFLAYIIPSEFDGEIVYECLAKCSFDVSELQSKKQTNAPIDLTTQEGRNQYALGDADKPNEDLANIVREKAQELYNKTGASAVYDYANLIGRKYSTCKPCEAETPTLGYGFDECLICGSSK